MSSGVDGHRQHPALRAEQPADPVEPLDVVAEQLPERDDQQVADGVAVHLALAAEAVLEHAAQVWPQSSSPQSAASAIRRSPGGSTPNSRRSRPEEPPSSATVTTAVRSLRDPAQRRQRGGQPVAAAERDDVRVSRCRALGHGHSRPRSRCDAATSMPASRSRPAISSVIATLRCLPPVQPMATVMNRLPSRR